MSNGELTGHQTGHQDRNWVWGGSSKALIRHIHGVRAISSNYLLQPQKTLGFYFEIRFDKAESTSVELRPPPHDVSLESSQGHDRYGACGC